MDNRKVAAELVKLAKALSGNSRAEHSEAFSDFDKAFEKYDDYVRSLPSSPARTVMLKALQGVTQAYAKLDSELTKKEK